MTAPRTSEIPSLNGIRAVAILVVFSEHASLPIHVLGSSGVTAFFFLSGYLITTLLRREQDKAGRVSLRLFYLRRALRIFPPMYLTLAIALVLAFTNIIPDHVRPAAAVASGLHLTNYWIIYEGRDGLVSTTNALWSLAVEEHFYLIFPLLLIGLTKLRLSRKRQAAALGGLCVAIMIWRCVLAFSMHASFDRIYLATDTRADSILWGCVFALVANPIIDRIRGTRTTWVWVLLPIGLVAFWIAQAVPQRYAITVGYTVQAAALALMFTAVICFPRCWAGRLLNWKPMWWLGEISYSFYLVHRMAIIGLSNRTSLGRYPLALAAFVVSVFASYLIWQFIDSPLRGLRTRLSSTAAPRHLAPARQ